MSAEEALLESKLHFIWLHLDFDVVISHDSPLNAQLLLQLGDLGDKHNKHCYTNRRPRAIYHE